MDGWNTILSFWGKRPIFTVNFQGIDIIWTSLFWRSQSRRRATSAISFNAPSFWSHLGGETRQVPGRFLEQSEIPHCCRSWINLCCVSITWRGQLVWGANGSRWRMVTWTPKQVLSDKDCWGDEIDVKSLSHQPILLTTKPGRHLPMKFNTSIEQTVNVYWQVHPTHLCWAHSLDTFSWTWFLGQVSWICLGHIYEEGVFKTLVEMVWCPRFFNTSCLDCQIDVYI